MSHCVTQAEALTKLMPLLEGVNLFELAREYGISQTLNGKLNKGWVGQTLERTLGIRTSNVAEQDGLDFELKATTVIRNNGNWSPKETIKITALNPQAALDETFETSVLWKKFSRLILVGYYFRDDKTCLVAQVQTVDLSKSKIKEDLHQFWDEVRYILSNGDYPLLESFGVASDLIQLRPLGDGTQLSLCPVSGNRFPARAFYATKRLVQLLFDGKF